MKKGRIFTLLLAMTLLMSLTVPAFAETGSEAETLGLAYYRGSDREQDYEKALEYLQKADQEGSTEVLFPLGEMFERGLGVKKNVVQAVQYYLRAAEAGSEQAREKLRQEPLKSIAAAVKVRKQATHVIGESGDVEGVRGPTHPLYLAKPLVDIKDLTLILSVDQLSGYPFGYFYLYVKDIKGHWHHTALFKIDKSMADGHYETYNLQFDQTEPAIVALAICPEEKGMDFTAAFDAYYIASAENVGEYSSSIPAPVYTPAKEENPISAVHQPTAPYSGPSISTNICPDSYINYNAGYKR
jgi:FOG: TPR repeat, SEL1 subfamily